SPAWLKATATRNDEMKKVETLVAADLQTVTTQVAMRARYTLWELIAGAAFLLSLTSVLAFMTARSITAPLSRLGETMTTLADDHTEVEIVGADLKNEIGNMARAMQVFRRNIFERRRLETERKAMEIHATEARRAELHLLADRFESTVAA